MSTTIEMTSPSSSIVVVDKSGSAEVNNLAQTSASQHHIYHHPHQIHAQQVIVNEEYLSGDNHWPLKTNDLLNNAQIIQSTASFDFGTMRGEAKLISGRCDNKSGPQHESGGYEHAKPPPRHSQPHYHHQQQHAANPQNDEKHAYRRFVDSNALAHHHGATTVLPQTMTNPNSKVHVISNVTLVSKGQQPHHQSISFVNSGKSVHAAHTHAVPMTKAGASVTGKMINIPYKTASVAHVQQLQPQSQTQSNPPHVITKHLNNPSAIIQKIPIPRNIHVLSAGRIQHQPQQQQQQQQLHHHITDEAAPIAHTQITRNAAPSHQTTANVIQVQKQNAIGKSNLSMGTLKAATTATATAATASMAKKHQTVKLINQTTGAAVAAQSNQQYTIQSQHVPINHQIKTKQTAQQRVYLTSPYHNDYHFQHAGVPQANEHANKNGPEYFRVNTSDIQSTTSTFVDNIPLISARTDEAFGYQQHGGANEQDDDMIGEEVRPLPIDSSMDSRMRALHALLQDHTYAQLPKKTAPATTPSGTLAAAAVDSVRKPASTASEHSRTSPTTRKSTSSLPESPQAAGSNRLSGEKSLVRGSPSTAAITANAQGKNANALATYAKQQLPSQPDNPDVTSPRKCVVVGPIQTSVSTGSTGAASTASTVSPFIPGFPFTYNAAGTDDDANSVISTGSRNNLDIDLGEETETAPEGEGEDDSVTRCICELAHDDGYMICCDKCSVWQHVDCMGIDRQNIPEEYKCELCQPRPVDHNRARTLQLMKRKEQQSFLLMGGAAATSLLSGQQVHNQQMPSTSQLSANELSMISERSMGGQVAVNDWRHNQLNQFSTIAANKKKGTLNKKGRKDKGESGSSSASKRKRGDLSASRAASAKQRREAKKASKRKSASSAGSATATAIGSNATSPSQSSLGDGNTTATPSSAATSDKQAANLRAWIESYEAAMTNHYSPELRARLHAIGKQQPNRLTSPPPGADTARSVSTDLATSPNSQQQGLSSGRRARSNPLKSVGSPENKCTTVPHAGGKILISTLDIYPNNPVIELRGKYMLSGQFQALHPLTTPMTSTPAAATATTAALTVANGTVPSKHAAGPFIFFYRLPNDGPEICVDTRTYGNEARFVRRSCRPNAEILHTIEKGTLHLYIVSLATIRASTEITIKHEPHDLEWLARSEISAPTSTICACGLIKECAFGIGNATGAPNANPNASLASGASSKSLSIAAQKKLAKRSNGHIKEKNSSPSSAPSTAHHKKKSLSSSSSRNRSRSSSSDHLAKSLHHNSEMSSAPPSADESPPAGSQFSDDLVGATAIGAATTTPTNVPVAATTAHLKSPDAKAMQPQPLHPPPIKTTSMPNSTGSVTTPTSNSSSPRPVFSPSSTSPRPVFGPADTLAVAGTTPTDEKVLKSLPVTPVTPASSGADSRLSSSTKLGHKKFRALSTSRKPASVGFERSSDRQRTMPIERKSTCSLSEDNSSLAGDEFAVTSPSALQVANVGATGGSLIKKDKEPKKVVENKKLTREERKMEAIVRAFEKMEKTEQRKNEQNKKSHPIGSGANFGSAVGSVNTSNRKRSISSSQKDKADDDKATPTKRSSLQQGRRKRKRGKSYSQPNHQRRRRNRNDSQNSEIGTSEDSNTFMMSPTLPSPVSFDHDPRPRERRPSDAGPKKTSDSDLAADLLLSLSTYGTNKSTSTDHLSTTPKSNASGSGMTAFPISSTCLLIEAAVGPLGHDFKLPTKAKTKKTIMNEWLHQSDSSAVHSPHSDLADQHLLSPNSAYSGVDSYLMHHDAKSQDHMQDDQKISVFLRQPDHSISEAAQKIEEFIQLSTASASSSAEQIGDDDESSSKWSGSNDVQTVPTPMPTPPLQLGSSVKKRWLRQAISEECSDEMLANSSATSSPPNGFMAPLKKRRVARQCSDLNAAEDLPSPNLAASNDGEKPSFIDRLDSDMNEEESSQATPTPIEVDEDDVDDEPTHVFVKMEAKAESIEIEADAGISNEIKSEDIKVEQNEPEATVEEIAGDNVSEVAEQKVDVKVKIEDDVDVKEDRKDFGQEQGKEENETEAEAIAEAERDESGTDAGIDDSGNAATAPIEPVECERAECDERMECVERIQSAKKAEIVKIKKIEDTDNNNTEYPTVTALHDAPLPKDEIEDIQQKLHSFHSENLMILQSRNKKRLSRATTPTSFDVEPKDLPAVTSSSSTLATPSKGHRASVPDSEDKPEESSTLHSEEKTPPSATPATVSHPSPAMSKKPAHLMTLSSAAPSMLSKPPPNAIYNNHWSQRNADGSEYPADPPNASKMFQQQSLSIPPPGFGTMHPHGPNATTPSSLYHYLENSNRSTHYSPLTYGTPPNLLNADQGTPTRSHSMFGQMHPNMTPGINSSNYLTKSYSTLSEKTTSVSVVSSPAAINSTPAAISNALTPKVLTRTQSADPRLNPPKDLPPVTPKRKLSINEYRKRKQLISGAASSADKVKTPETPAVPETEVTKSNALDAVKPKNGLTVASETKETVFSPAPTLLELQQESLSQRLKSYKSLHEISTTNLGTSKPKDASTENDELHLLRNLEPSSALSSSNSSSLRSSPSLKSFDGEDTFASFIEPNEPCREEAIDSDNHLPNDMRSRSTTCDISSAKKTSAQSTITSAVPSISLTEIDVSGPQADSQSMEKHTVGETQAKCESSSAGNISPNENTSR